MSVTLEELLVQRKEASKMLAHLNARIDEYRVKCSTCRCRILPSEACYCCADIDLNEPPI